jgi:hypothetical protein
MQITETLLDERRDESEEYADMIDYHVDSARDSSSAGDGGAMLEDGSEAPIWKRRQSVRRFRCIQGVGEVSDHS